MSKLLFEKNYMSIDDKVYAKSFLIFAAAISVLISMVIMEPFEDENIKDAVFLACIFIFACSICILLALFNIFRSPMLQSVVDRLGTDQSDRIDFIMSAFQYLGRKVEKVNDKICIIDGDKMVYFGKYNNAKTVKYLKNMKFSNRHLSKILIENHFGSNYNDWNGYESALRENMQFINVCEVFDAVHARKQVGAS